jgi:homoserine kinase type II
MAMTEKTEFLKEDILNLMGMYKLGDYNSYKTFAQGTLQTTIMLQTSTGKYVLKYYENRSKPHVVFEVQLTNFLEGYGWPVAPIIKNENGEFISEYKSIPYIIIKYIEGEHCKNPNDYFDTLKMAQVIKVLAEMHTLTNDQPKDFWGNKEVYDISYCRREFKKQHSDLVDKYGGKWFENELNKLEFPDFLPKGICHADLNYTNFLFKENHVVAVLDFDMSIHTCLIYDIANMIYWWTDYRARWEDKKERAKFIIREYTKWRSIDDKEREYIFDALKLVILLGISWSNDIDFQDEIAKFEALNKIGRNGLLN